MDPIRSESPTPSPDPSQSADAEVILDAVTKRWGDVVAVDAVDLSLAAGEFLVFLGPSGCGKTTTLRMIAGFERPTSGRIILHGKDITQIPPHKRHLGMVFQNYALFPHLNVRRNVAFGLEIQRAKPDTIAIVVRDVLGRVGLDGYEERYPAELSGGQQQRVAIARALAVRPRVLLLDEPFGALDRKLRIELQRELRSLQEELGLSTAFVTHDQEEAMALADRIVVMRDGRIEQVDPPAVMYERPRTRYVAGFMGDANFLRGTVVHRDQDVEVRLSDGHGIRVPSAAYLSDEVRPGHDVDVLLRPEQLSFGEDGGAGGIRGRIEDAVFLGEKIRYQVATPAHATIAVVRPAGERLRPVPGDEVGIGFDPQLARVFPVEESTA